MNIIFSCLSHRFSPSDILILTAAVKTLHQTYPNRFETDIRTSYPAIIKSNPFIRKVELSTARIIQPVRQKLCDMQLPLPIIFTYTKGLGKELGVTLEPAINKPDIYLSEEEMNWEPPITQPYWLINSGINPGMSTKCWGGYQTVINHFKDSLTFVQIGRGEDRQYKLTGVIDMIGKMTLRELILWTSKSQSAVGPTGLLQHLYAAFDKPYFCICGGTANIHSIQYPKQQVFHTIGQLPCCQRCGCHRKTLIPLAEQKTCYYPLQKQNTKVAACMDLIKPAEIILTIQRFLTASNTFTLP